MVRELGDSARSEREMMHRVALAAQSLLKADASCVLTLDGDIIEVAASSGSAAPYVSQRTQIQPSPSLFRDVISSGIAEFTNDPFDPRIDPRFRDLLRISQLAVAPIAHRGQLTGLLMTVNSTNGGYSDQDLSKLTLLADQCAVVMENQSLVRRAHLAAKDASRQVADSQRSAHHNGVLARTARALANAATRDAIHETIAALFRTEMQVDGLGIYEANPQLHTMRLDYQSGLGSVDPARVDGEFYHAVTGATVQSAAPLFIRDCSAHPDLHLDLWYSSWLQDDITSVALIPLLQGRETRGLLTLQFVARRPLDHAERVLMQDMAIQIALAFRNMNSLAALERRAKRLAGLSEAQQHLAKVIDPDQLPEAIAAAAHSVFPSAICDVYAIQNGSLRRILVVQDGKATPHGPASESESALARETLRTGVPRLAVQLHTNVHGPRGTAELCAVVRYGTRGTGLLRLVANNHDAFDLQDLDLLSILTRQAGAAVERARAFTMKDFQRQRAEGAAELARATLRSSNVADGANELLTVLDRFVPSIGKAIGLVRSRDGDMEYVAASS